MLTESQLDDLTEPILRLYSEFETTVLVDIARRLGHLDYSSAAYQVQRLSESGLLYDEIITQVAALTGTSKQVLRDVFEDAGVKTMKFDDSIYQRAGLSPLPLNMSPAMASVLAAGLNKTNGVIQNMTMTTALKSQEAFIHAADLAYLQVSTGAFSYNEAIRNAVVDVTDKGMPFVRYPSGHVDNLDVAVRRAVLTGVSQTTGKLQEMRAGELGVDLVQTSAHASARPTHAVWQGQIFSLTGQDKRYQSLAEGTGYGTGPGLMGWNCRHSFYPFFDGISKNAYDEETLNDYANQKVVYNNKTMSVYDATQEQRRIERKIRWWKRREDAIKAAGLDASYETSKVHGWQAIMRDFIRQMNLQQPPGVKWYRQYEREYIIGRGPRQFAVPRKPAPPTPAPVPPAPAPEPPKPIDPRGIELDKTQMKIIQDKNLDRLSSFQRFDGMSKSEIAAQVQADLYKTLNAPNTRISVRTNSSHTDLILGSGRLKSQFETSTSSGMLATDVRANAEKQGLGVPITSDVKSRPIYGSINVKNHVTAYGYGDVEWVMKNDVRKRATTTYSDSLEGFMYNKQMGTPVVKPDTEFFIGYVDARDYESLMNFDFGSAGYIEAQIFGGVDLARDIDAVRMTITSTMDRDYVIMLLGQADRIEQALPGIKVHFDFGNVSRFDNNFDVIELTREELMTKYSISGQRR